MRNWIRSLKENDMFAWGDLIIIGALIFLSFVPLMIFSHNQAQTETEITSGATNKPREVFAVISHDGKLVKKFNLTKSKKNITWRYADQAGHYNLIELKNHKIHIKEANCNDQICVRQGYKSKPGETIVCLPHKLLIEIKSSDGKAENGGMVN